jgi:molecular chaperone GrpE
MSKQKAHHHEEPEQGHEQEELDPEVAAGIDEEEEGAPSVDDLAAAAAEAESEVEGGSERREIVERLQQEAYEAQDRYLRTYAEFENYRKRAQRDLTEFRKYANEQLAQDLLTVLDHLGLALKHAKEAGGAGHGLQEGVELVYKQFCDTLEKYGVKPFKAEGERFDPKLHDAMMQVETADVPENTVVQVFQDGYLYHEKVLRHARVGVSKRPADAPQDTQGIDAAGGDDVDAGE